ncbi:hypothetical protein K501DRAFT_321812 [Backusella circina FSU 941]|nr:hypothetical protein K501DRAFT_321812 [Backusella circina FSU 941]
MSKRQRSESVLLEIQSVLPDVPVSQLETLLHQANYNIETAINIYFSNPPPPTPSLPTATQVDSTARVDRFYIGDIVSTGWSTFRGQSPVTEGSPIDIRREKQTGYKKNENKIVRFSYKGSELGRLSKEISGYIATLIDHEQCEFEGSVVWCPNQLKTGDDMIITVRCYLLAKSMHAGSLDNNNASISKKQRSITKLLNTNNNDLYLTNRKIALVSLFKALGLRPTRSSIQNEENGWDRIIESFEIKQEEENGEGENEEEEKKEVSDDQLNTIYEKAQVFDSEIMPMETPDTMSLELKPYQKRALAWMVNKEAFEHSDGDIDMRSMHPLWEEYALPGQPLGEYSFFYFSPYNGELSLTFPESNSQERGGILADEMGLGKTIEALSLIHANKPPLEQHNDALMKRTKKSPTTLVVCPMSLLAQWRDEILRGSKKDTISVKVYYGNERSLDLYNKLCRWDGSAPDVLLTTYGVVMSVWNTLQTEKNQGVNLFQIDFWRVMLDEAHQIKNHMSKTSQACRDIQARRRWAITGTPIQNKLDDLFALVKYLRHEPWANHTFWNSFITLPFKNQDKNALKTVQTVLEPLVLRRTKQMKDKAGNPMVPLPPKYINIEYLSFTPEEQDIYDAFYNDSKTKFSYYISAGQIGSNYANILQLLTRLRQICCHPYLAIKQNQTTGDVNPSLENLISDYNSKYAKSEEKGGSSGTNYGLSVLQSMLSKQQASQTTSSPDSPAVDMKTEDIKEEEEEGAKMEAIDLPDECPICFEPIDVIVAMPCMHMACRLCVLEYFQKRENDGLAGECPVCRVGPILQSELLEITEQNPKAEKDNITYEIQRAVGGYRPSGKIQALLKHVRQNLANNNKTVVFSQFTSFLDLIQQALLHEDIIFTRLDGTLQQFQRERVLKEFSESAETNVLLISLKAGGVGLNLTCANQVIMMDPWWNFAVEAQAIDRIHRLGQQKDVTVTRFIMRDTVEERILEIQDRKHDLVNELYKTDSQSKGQKLQDLQILFRSSRS